ncbi:MAG: K(+)/H(+) antiporter NhaP2 [uncultured Gemmatimonadaceae bacterium]|uniref:K(+)/H(+) antiporter NhaP2 n=1 Tax=uncultured Gemmatimonadaceae bacterium TaxID=246130 RepID=A0A6J4M5Q2_9BACT|nr:MAG: K(+)/H(+) antiporter NhaP2 [uncultured Gemmatimonadaceae bacterium]
MTEPFASALLFATVGLLLLASTLLSRASERVGVPLALVFLLVGVAAGSEGVGGIAFDDYALAYRLGTAALVLILFDGGLNTPVEAVRRGLRPAATLATVGVLGTTAVVAAGAHALGFPWPAALLIGAVVSPTDAAAVFAVLRGSGISLKRRVGTTLELESGINDPVAVILTTLLTRNAIAPGSVGAWELPVELLRETAIGLAAGLAVGYGVRAVLARFRLPAGGLYPVVTLAAALLAFGAPTLLHGSGFLGVYVAGVVLGNGSLPYRGGLLRVHDALAWISQVGMFLLLGLLVFPSRLAAVAPQGLALALLLALVARPLVAALCLLPFRYTARETGYVGWVGLRGAVPIILAAFPVLAGAPDAARLFDVVFFIVVVTALVPGGTVPWVTRRLKLASDSAPAPPAVLAIESLRPLRGQLRSFYIEPALAVAGVALADLPFPDGASAALIVRGEELLAPRGATTLEPGDHVYVFARPEDEALIQLMFGRPEE